MDRYNAKGIGRSDLLTRVAEALDETEHISKTEILKIFLCRARTIGIETVNFEKDQTGAAERFDFKNILSRFRADSAILPYEPVL